MQLLACSNDARLYHYKYQNTTPQYQTLKEENGESPLVEVDRYQFGQLDQVINLNVTWVRTSQCNVPAVVMP